MPFELVPGATIGILGGGQLGRMLALAAAKLGIKTHVYAQDPESPAFDVASARTIAPYEDELTLAEFAGAVELITYEFENIPSRTAAILAEFLSCTARPRDAGGLPGSSRREGVFGGGGN